MSLQQVLAPQLQQSLALLQAPTLELKALVEQELEQNPVLEELPIEEMEQRDKNERADEDAPPQAPDLAEPPADVKDQSFEQGPEKPAEPVDDFEAEFERLTQLDQEWRDHFAQTNLPMKASAASVHITSFLSAFLPMRMTAVRTIAVTAGFSP